MVEQVQIDASVRRAARHWNLQVKEIREDMPMAGSPERYELRFVVHCHDNRLYVLESLFKDHVGHKHRIIGLLDYLSRQGTPAIRPYLCTKNKGCIVNCDDRFWQLAPYIEGAPLDRPGYVFDNWRGSVLAGFLIDLREKARDVPGFSPLEPFSIKGYIYGLMSQIKRHKPELFKEMVPVVAFLEKRFMAVHDRLPVAFCHGDYHPLNVIWSSDSIHAVIDWEFSGYKPEIYDIANLIGCSGMEDPGGLSGDLVKELVRQLRGAGMISDLSWEHLCEFVVAMRFAWMSEWLRNQDQDMIDLEALYMRLLVAHSERLKSLWGL
ncbi:MAG: aminoglycoside phosphotransferase family protein [Thermodesulfobacteriota bacterium]|nr:aminoglycoside phosphotransferase family protein [Thermodesulfobacteriota bacterium]